MDLPCGGLWEDHQGEDIAQNPIHLMDAITPDDEFALGAPPPLNEGVGEGVEKRSVGSGEAMGGAVVGAKGRFAARPEAEEAKKRRANTNTERRVEMEAKRFCAHLRSLGVEEEDAVSFWGLESSDLCNCICDWIHRMRGVGHRDLSPREIICNAWLYRCG